MGVEGIDTSAYQRTVNWGAAQAGGVGWAYVKATQGHGFVDTQFAASWHEGLHNLTGRGAYDSSCRATGPVKPSSSLPR